MTTTVLFPAADDKEPEYVITFTVILWFMVSEKKEEKNCESWWRQK